MEYQEEIPDEDLLQAVEVEALEHEQSDEELLQAVEALEEEGQTGGG